MKDIANKYAIIIKQEILRLKQQIIQINPASITNHDYNNVQDFNNNLKTKIQQYSELCSSLLNYSLSAIDNGYWKNQENNGTIGKLIAEAELISNNLNNK